MLDDVQGALEKFMAVPWHDSKVLSVRVHITAAAMDHKIEIELDLLVEARPVEATWQLARVTFGNAVEFGADLDLLAAARCEHAIFGAESEVIDVAAEGGISRRVGRFAIILCPPSGSISIVAPRFILEVLGERRTVPVGSTSGN